MWCCSGWLLNLTNTLMTLISFYFFSQNLPSGWIFYFIFWFWMFCLHLWLCITSISGALKGQERVLHSLELELQWVTLWVLRINLGPLAEQAVLFTKRTSLQPRPHSCILTMGKAVFSTKILIHGRSWWPSDSDCTCWVRKLSQPE